MIKAILTDIEGTTTSISFVYDVLFPYAREHLAEYVREHAGDSEIIACIDAVCAEVGHPMTFDEVIAQLEQWMAEDKKITPLKELQGLVWDAGYRNGDFTGHVYADASLALQKWYRQGIDLYVYSSGSVRAQKLLFAHTDYGDLTSLFIGYFDTTIGAKSDAASYQRIIEELMLEPDEILFLSDVESELQAASNAGMQTCWLVRNGDVDPAASHRQVKNFAEITLE